MTYHFLKEDLSGGLLMENQGQSYYLQAGAPANYLRAILISSVNHGHMRVSFNPPGGI